MTHSTDGGKSVRPDRSDPASNGHAIMENVDDILALFQRTGAYMHGHFRLTSGLHSPEYLQCALVLQHPHYAEALGTRLARSLEEMNPTPIKLVAAPAMGGIIIGHEVARALKARSIFTERDSSGKMALRRGFHVEPGETAVVIEDVITTGAARVRSAICFAS